jgi:uncharacterized protein (TIGR02646 family)
MRRLTRLSLPAAASAYLTRCQSRVSAQQEQGAIDIDHEWRRARSRKSFTGILNTLHDMSGPHRRCMYCTDSHGGDIEHFRPKKPFPETAFTWPNLLLCCPTCNRLKGDRFPLQSDGQPLLIDPSAEDPWLHLDFEPESGLIKARYDAHTDQRSAKGLETVRLLNLDRREVTVGHQKTFRRLNRSVRQFLANTDTELSTATQLVARLREDDDHGLLPWCFGDIGRTVDPFNRLREQQPDTWAACEAVFL